MFYVRKCMKCLLLGHTLVSSFMEADCLDCCGVYQLDKLSSTFRKMFQFHSKMLETLTQP